MKAKLHWSSRSPFVTKVIITLHETQQAVLHDNPLGKIPVYVPDERPALFDSREYLAPTLRALDLPLKTRTCIQAVPAAQHEDSSPSPHPFNFKLD